MAAGALFIALATGCGTSPQHDRSSKSPAHDHQISFTGVAESARLQWYDTVKRAPDANEAITLSEDDVERATQAGAAAVGATLVAVHYVPLLGGTADVVVQPNDPVPFAEQAGRKIATLVGPLAREGRAYLVTVVDSTQTPLLVLGWNPSVAQAGEGVAWQAPGIRSDAIIGQPVIVASEERSLPDAGPGG